MLIFSAYAYAYNAYAWHRSYESAQKLPHVFATHTQTKFRFFTARQQEIDFVPLVISLIVYVTLLVAALRVLTSRIE